MPAMITVAPLHTSIEAYAVWLLVACSAVSVLCFSHIALSILACHPTFMRLPEQDSKLGFGSLFCPLTYVVAMKQGADSCADILVGLNAQINPSVDFGERQMITNVFAIVSALDPQIRPNEKLGTELSDCPFAFAYANPFLKRLSERANTECPDPETASVPRKLQWPRSKRLASIRSYSRPLPILRRCYPRDHS